MSKKLFAIEEAEKVLPSVKGLLRKAMVLNKQLRSLRQELVLDQEEVQVQTEDQSVHYRFELVKDHELLNQLTEDFYEVIEAIHALGCEVKDLDNGLVDFPSRFEGRIIYLCYKIGEDRIRHWHELGAGFQGRQKIVELS